MVGDVAYFLKKMSRRLTSVTRLRVRTGAKAMAMEAVRRLLAYLFDELDLHRVIAITDVENIPSFHMLERLGFRREGHFVENLMFKGHWGSEYYYGMLKREWEKLTS
jgi:[ribosomal protein S5]-alanine N-acetyltransferase